MDLEWYRSLPDSMKSSDLQEYFMEVINAIIRKKSQPIVVIEVLVELAVRQWHTYEILDTNIKDKLEDWIVLIWTTDSLELVENIVSITAHLGLTRVFDLMKKSYEHIVDTTIKEVVYDAIEELEGNIGNPYSGMK